jgi:pimeloyl-ACP methyl ester carboxylesterase
MELLITDMEIPVNDAHLTGHLVIPENSSALVIFSHGSGSSRFSPRNRYVAEMLNRKNIATLLTDLLTPEEDDHYENRFDMALLSDRLCEITRNMNRLPQLKGFSFGYFGASSGAAAALNAAAEMPDIIHGMVLRGGRPDLAPGSLKKIKAPTLMIVGGLDLPVIEINRQAAKQMNCIRKIVIVEGAGHLFEEADKLESVSSLASEWFERHLMNVH